MILLLQMGRKDLTLLSFETLKAVLSEVLRNSGCSERCPKQTDLQTSCLKAQVETAQLSLSLALEQICCS